MEQSTNTGWTNNPDSSARPVLVVDSGKHSKTGKPPKTGSYRALSGVSFQDLDMYVRETSSHIDQTSVPHMEIRRDSVNGQSTLPPISHMQQRQNLSGAYANDPRYYYEGQIGNIEHSRRIQETPENYASYPSQSNLQDYPVCFGQPYPYQNQQSSYNQGQVYNYQGNCFNPHQYNAPGYQYPHDQYFKSPNYEPQNYPHPIANPPPCFDQNSRYYGGPFSSQAPAYPPSYSYPYSGPFAGTNQFMQPSVTPQTKRKNIPPEPTRYLFPSPSDTYSSSKHLSLEGIGQGNAQNADSQKGLRKSVLSADSLENVNFKSNAKDNLKCRDASENSLCSPPSVIDRQNSCEYDSLEDLRPKHVSELKTFFESKSSINSSCNEDRSSSREASVEKVIKSDLDSAKMEHKSQEEIKSNQENMATTSQLALKVHNSENLKEADTGEGNVDVGKKLEASFSESQKTKESHIGDVSFLRATKDTPLTLLASTRLVQATMKPPMKPTTFYIALDSKFDFPTFEDSSESGKDINDSLPSEIVSDETDSETSKNDLSENIISSLSISSSSLQSATPAEYQESQLLLRHFVSDWRCVSPSVGSDSDIDEFFLVLDSTGGEKVLDFPSFSRSCSPNTELSAQDCENDITYKIIQEIGEENDDDFAQVKQQENEETTQEKLMGEDKEHEQKQKNMHIHHGKSTVIQEKEGSKEILGIVEEELVFEKEQGDNYLNLIESDMARRHEAEKSEDSTMINNKATETLEEKDSFLGNSDLSNDQPFLGLGKDRNFEYHKFSVLQQNVIDANIDFSNKASNTDFLCPLTNPSEPTYAEIEKKNSYNFHLPLIDKMSSKKNIPKNGKLRIKNEIKHVHDLKSRDIKKVSALRVTASRPEIYEMPLDGPLICIGKNGKGKLLSKISFSNAFIEILPLTISLPHSSSRDLALHQKVNNSYSFCNHFNNANSYSTSNNDKENFQHDFFVPATCSLDLCKTFSFGNELSSSVQLTQSDLEFLATLIANKIINGDARITSLASKFRVRI